MARKKKEDVEPTMVLVYQQFNGNVPSEGSLARPVKAGYASIQCKLVEAGSENEGWHATLDEAEFFEDPEGQ